MFAEPQVRALAAAVEAAAHASPSTETPHTPS
jgi:hypothetical protein